MADVAAFDHTTPREARYDQLEMQCAALLSDPDPVANQANFVALVNMAFGWHWLGFYRVLNGELVLGPFQGPVACTRLSKDKGVCAAAWSRNESVVVQDVDAFPGHVVCSAESRSELVVPVRDSEGQVRAVFDVDSDAVGDFTQVDADRLQRLIDGVASRLIEESIPGHA